MSSFVLIWNDSNVLLNFGKENTRVDKQIVYRLKE